MTALQSYVREFLPRNYREPVWIERWLDRAVAAVLLDRPGVTEYILVTRRRERLSTRPMTRAKFQRWLHV